MRITILGTRGNVKPSAPKHARHSGILVDGELLLDLGEATYLRYQPRHIFVTHLHVDHAVFMEEDITPNALVYVPEPTNRLRSAHVISGPAHIHSYKITPVPTVHSERVRSVGYVVEDQSKSFFYSSDMVSIEPQHRKELRHLNMVITEGSFIRRGGLVKIHQPSGRRYGHAGIPDLIEFFEPLANCIVITHFGSWFYKNIDASVRKIESLGNGARVIAAYDGMTLRI
jgi:ribonuclease BN (tRNA processing enzyme)